jgi:beta-glucanase (GH16 family)
MKKVSWSRRAKVRGQRRVAVAAVASLTAILAAGFVSACGEGSKSAGATMGDAGKDWTNRPQAPLDRYGYFTPDDEPNPCQLAGPPPSTPGEVLVFADEFDGTQVDPAKWNVRDSYIGFSNTVNTSSAANAQVHDGSLFLVTDVSAAGAAYPYVSASLDTKGKFARTYGKIEMRGRFPHAPGVWYEQMGRPWTGDYPLVKTEILNRPDAGDTQLYFGQEWAPTTETDRYASQLVEGVDFSQEHTYTVVWKPDSIEWFLDGVSKLPSTKGLTSLPTYWTIGAWVGGWPGKPTPDTTFPVSFQIDSFRVYRVDGVVGDLAIAVSNPRGRYFKDEAIELQLANLDEACAHVNVYEGDWRLAMRATPSYRLPLAKISHGKHTLRFVATDGDRSGETSFTFIVN